MRLETRIRAKRDNHDPQEIARGLSAYEEFIAGRDSDSNPDLYRYFAKDFFHDGPIESLTIDPANRVLSFRTIADLPVSRVSEANDRVGHSAHAGFVCKFLGVGAFEMRADADPQAEYWLARQASIEFLYSEIDTLEEDMARQSNRSGGSLHSILIEAFPRTTIGIVFERVELQCEESLAFHAIRQLGLHDVSLYEPQRRRSRTNAADAKERRRSV